MRKDMTKSQNTIETIASALSACGLKYGGTVLVHSSLRSLRIENPAESLLKGILLALGENGTLLVPALSYKIITQEEKNFDINKTPSCIGVFPEYFRTYPGVLRSLHPTHSVCGLGKQAKVILSKHHFDNTPCGLNSPYAALRDCAGQIIFIGCGIKPNTSMHGVEETVYPYPPYLFSESVQYILKDNNGNTFATNCLRHDFTGYTQHYDRIEKLLLSTEISKGNIADAEIVIMDASAVWKRGKIALLKNKLFFVEKTQLSPFSC